MDSRDALVMPAEDHVDLVAGGEPLCILRVVGHRRLGVVLDELQLLAEHPAGGVDLVDREDERIGHLVAVDADRAGTVVQPADPDGVGTRGLHDDGRRHNQRGAADPDPLEQCATIDFAHRYPP